MVHTAVGASLRMKTTAASASSGRICLPDSNMIVHNCKNFHDLEMTYKCDLNALCHAFKSHSLPTHSPLVIFSVLRSTMSLWVDQVNIFSFSGLKFILKRDYPQYRPRTLDTLHYHQGLSERLKSLVCCK